MKCPACDGRLTTRNVGPIDVDVCHPGCGGSWFDNFELAKVAQAEPPAVAPLADVVADPTVEVNTARQRRCPRCTALPLRRHPWRGVRTIEIDECPGCGGTWLDAGEVAAIRATVTTEDFRTQAARAHFEAIHGGDMTELAARNRQLEDEIERNDRTRRWWWLFGVPGWF